MRSARLGRSLSRSTIMDRQVCSFRGRSAGFSVTRYVLVGGLLGMEGFNQVRYHKHVAVGWLFLLCMYF